MDIIIHMAFRLLILNSSVRKETPTSAIDTEEVRVAKRRAPKNTMATALPIGIREKIYGKVSYTSEGPDAGSTPKAKTAGIMAQPAKIAMTMSIMVVLTL